MEQLREFSYIFAFSRLHVRSKDTPRQEKGTMRKAELRALFKISCNKQTEVKMKWEKIYKQCGPTYSDNCFFSLFKVTYAAVSND